MKAHVQPPHRSGHAETEISGDRRAHRCRVPRAVDRGVRDGRARIGGGPARKRPSPFLRGHSRTWACGITDTIGSVNFLFDPTQNPHVRGSDLCALFGVSQNAGAAKSREILRVFDIVPLDPQIRGGRCRAGSRTIRWSG